MSDHLVGIGGLRQLGLVASDFGCSPEPTHAQRLALKDLENLQVMLDQQLAECGAAGGRGAGACASAVGSRLRPRILEAEVALRRACSEAAKPSYSAPTVATGAGDGPGWMFWVGLAAFAAGSTILLVRRK